MFFNKKKNDESDSFDLVKIAALLIHAARIDEKYSIEEEEIIKKTLLDLGTDQNELETIIKKAKQSEENAHQILDIDFNRDSLIPNLMEIWVEPKSRLFTIFVAVSMTAYFMQELILEPYAGIVFSLSPGQTTSLSGIQNGGVFFGMLAVGISVSGFKIGSLRIWVFSGCIGSALSLIAISGFAYYDFGLPVSLPIAFLGFFNGAFAVGAIGSMMQLAGSGKLNREGTRMGLWGASQAIAAGFGGLLGTILVDILRLFFINPADAFGLVFSFEAILFILAAVMSLRIINPNHLCSSNQPLGALK